jgi:hypothetical protein
MLNSRVTLLAILCGLAVLVGQSCVASEDAPSRETQDRAQSGTQQSDQKKGHAKEAVLDAVRPDGTIHLGFYGSLYVRELTCEQIKIKLIKHLRKTIKDEALDLIGEANTNEPEPSANEAGPTGAFIPGPELFIYQVVRQGLYDPMSTVVADRPAVIPRHRGARFY